METMKKYKYVALDLDGTTLNDQHFVSEYNINVLRKINELGICIMIATGRQSHSVYQVLQQLMLPQEITYVVCFNGTQALAVKNNNFSDVERIFNRIVPKEIGLEITCWFESLGLMVNIYSSQTSLIYSIDPTNEEQSTLLDKFLTFNETREHLPSYVDIFATHDANKIVVLTNDPHGLIDTYLEKFDHYNLQIILGSPEPFFVEFLPENVNKGESFRCVAEIANIKLEDVVAFGDGDNDKEFLKYSGLGIAMKNAKSPAKEVADIVLEVSFMQLLAHSFQNTFLLIHSGQIMKTLLVDKSSICWKTECWLLANETNHISVFKVKF
jgi:hypothetical protein